MPIPFGPILAQVVELSVGDRSEVRLIAAPSRRLEGVTVPTVGVRSTWKDVIFSAGYGATLAVVPLDSEPRATSLFHTIFVAGSYRWQHTTLAVGQSLGIGSLNFATQALSDPGTNQTANSGVNLPGGGNGGGAAPAPPITIGTVIGPGGAPVNSGPPGTTVGGSNQLRAVNKVVDFSAASTRAGVIHELTPVTRLGFEVGYTIAGGLTEEDKTYYPEVRGSRAGALVAHRLNPRDEVSSTAVLQYSSNALGASSWLALIGEGLAHRFSPRTSGNAGVGVAYSRLPLGNGFTSNSIYPTFSLGIGTVTYVSRGTLSLNAAAGSAPALDPITQIVDPRVTLAAGAGFQKQRYFAAASVSSALSVAGQNEPGALKAVGASLGVGYQFVPALSADAGVRAAYQSYQGTNVIPLTYGVFVGVTFGATSTLK